MSEPMSVLLLEDHAPSAKLVRSQVRSAGGEAHLDHVETLGDGIERLQGRRYDVALLDLHLPDSAGAETVRAVRERSDVPIVAVTALKDPHVLEAARQAGAHSVLLKGEEDGGSIAAALREAAETDRA